jgi:hypothetical protein
MFIVIFFFNLSCWFVAYHLIFSFITNLVYIGGNDTGRWLVEMNNLFILMISTKCLSCGSSFLDVPSI